MRKKGLQLSAIVVLSLALMYFFFRSVEWKEVLHYVTDINLKILVLIVLITPVHLLTRAIRWNYLLKHEKADVSLYNRFAANTIGFTVTLVFPGRIGELVKPLYLAQKENMKKGFVIGTVVVERIFDILTMCFLLGLFLVAKPLYSPFFHIDEEAFSSLYLWGKVGVAASGALLLIVLALYFFRDKTLSVINLLVKPLPKKISGRILELFREFVEGLKFFHSIGNMLIYILLSHVVWLGIVFYYWIFFMAFDIHVAFFVVFPYTFLTMVGASIPTPGMVGGYHYFSKLGMTSFFKVGANLAVGVTIVVHAVQVLVTCLLGYVILWKEGLSIFQIRQMGEDKEQ